MDRKHYNLMKSRFNAVYCSLPLAVRQDIVHVHKKYGGMTWYACWIEIYGDTAYAHDILETLEKLDIISVNQKLK